jgi:hypothetical protein
MRNHFRALLASLVVAFASSMALGAAAESLAAQASIPADLRYEIINETTSQNQRRSLDVRLSRKVDAEVLEALAVRLRDQATTRFARTFIVYYLPGMEIDAGGWATSHFNPDLEVRILGTAAEGGSPLDRLRSEHGDALIGVWENNQPGFAGTFAIFGTESGFGLERVFPDGSVGRKVLVERPSQSGRRFADPENRFGEFYLIRGGNLELHDSEGMVFRARPVSGGSS